MESQRALVLSARADDTGADGFESRAPRAVGRMTLDGRRRIPNLELPEEAEELRESIRAELATIAALDDRGRLGPLGSGGWVQPHMSKPWGRAAGPLEQIVISQELKKAGITLPQLAMGGWAVQAIEAYGTEEQQQRWIAPTLRGESIWCHLFSEPEAGSDLASLTAKAERVDGGWKINGQKIWTSLAQFSEWAMLIARTDASKPKHEGITYFILDMKTAGVTVRPLREMTGGTLFNQVFLDDVVVPDDCVIGQINQGWDVARKALAGERVALGNANLPMYASMENLLSFVAAEVLSETATIEMGNVVCQNQARDLIGLRGVLQQLRGADASTSSSIGKFLSTRLSQQLAEFGFELLGSNAALGGQQGRQSLDGLFAREPSNDDLRRHDRGSAERYRRANARPSTRRFAGQVTAFALHVVDLEYVGKQHDSIAYRRRRPHANYVGLNCSDG